MPHTKAFAHELSIILHKNKAITADVAQELVKDFADKSKSATIDFLMEEGLVEKEDLLQALSEYYKEPFVDVDGKFFDHFQVRRFPKDFLLRNAIIPLQVDQDMLAIVAADPSVKGLESAIRSFVSYDIVFRVGIERDICDAIKEYYDEALTVVPNVDEPFEQD